MDKKVSDLEKIKTVVKGMKVGKRENKGFVSTFVELTLINGKKLECRIKDYDFASLLEEININDFVVTLETRRSDKKDKDFDCIVVALPSIGYETFAYINVTQMAIINLLYNKK